jgi:hypothetical protein
MMSVLAAPKHRVPPANYVELMQAGIGLCNEPALALPFGGAVRLKDVSISGVMGGAFDGVQSMHKDMNRYAALGLDEDLGDSAAPFAAIRSKNQSLFER